MAKYEYNTIDFVERDDIPLLLGKEGEKGWELVTAIPITKPPTSGEHFTLIFLRRKASIP